MKKILMCLVASIFSICAFAAGYKYTAQCKMNSTSYVVVEQEDSSGRVIAHGYGDAANSTVVITTAPKKDINGTKYTATITIQNGYGETTINSAWRVISVSNIACY